VTTREIQRIMQEYSTPSDSLACVLTKLRDRPFYVWSKEKRKSMENPNSEFYGRSDFNHIIGLPQKNGVPQPLHDYQHMIYKALTCDEYLNQRTPTLEEEKKFRLDKIEVENKTSSKAESVKKANELYLKNKAKILVHKFKIKHLFIKKATGLGITEFMLRFMAFLALRNDDYKNSQMVIITGPNQELAIKCIKRIKGFFEPHGITFDSKETVVNLNGCEIQAYPSNHIDAFRSLTNPKFILLLSSEDTIRPNTLLYDQLTSDVCHGLSWHAKMR
jgi:hypothetical protein